MTRLLAPSRIAITASLLLCTGSMTMASHHRSHSRPINRSYTSRTAMLGYSAPLAAPGQSGSCPQAAQIALQYRGCPYVYGGTTSRGFDCSGFVRYVYSRLGRGLPRTPGGQYTCGRAVAFSQLQPGDILFFHTYRPGISHVGIYIGNNQFVHAANPRRGVVVNEIRGYYSERLVGARRVS